MSCATSRPLGQMSTMIGDIRTEGSAKVLNSEFYWLSYMYVTAMTQKNHSENSSLLKLAREYEFCREYCPVVIIKCNIL